MGRHLGDSETPVRVAQRWLDAEPDEDVRDELRSLIDGDPDELATRFTGGLTFGTAGLRAAVGAGPLRMNRLVVRQAAAGLVDHLLRTVPDAAERGLIIGYDARHKSDDFAMDTARVAVARGMRAMLLPRPLPTPVLAWNITMVGAAAGVMVTASHNPPADNGYKVYLGSGAQIVPPHDDLIAAAIAAVDPCSVPLSDPDHPRIAVLDESVVDRYVDFTSSVRLRPGVSAVRVAYTALHGVGGDTVLRAFAAAGLPEPIVVAEQQRPDGSFPTVAFPNPEEPGAMDRVLSLAGSVDADVAIANDPDADRLGVAVPTPDGDWRRLTGDEIGWLLADHILRHSVGDDRMVVTTLVSSSLLSKMAETHGVSCVETFTGFKWIADAALRHPDRRLVFGYEQALGYLVASTPLDKDGITAAVMMAELVADLKSAGSDPTRRLDEIAEAHGRHVTSETSVGRPPAAGRAAVAALRDSPPTSIGGLPVVAVVDYPEAGLLRLWLLEEGGRGVRIQVRPSGTEPKVKIYGEAVERGADELARLVSEVATLI